MLRRVGETIDPKGAVVKIKDASFPAPFASELEYNSPVHGSWNIVHTGMQVPESIQIYVCADNCMRGVVLTAAEMNAADRFSFVILEEQDLLNSNLEDITIEGVTDVLNKRGEHPNAVLLFTVCLHHFVGSNLDYIYSELGQRFPDICFIRCYMDPIMQKHGLTPDQKLRKAMYDPLPACEPDRKTVSIFGSDFALDETSDIRRLLKWKHIEVKELPECNSWKSYQELADSKIFIACYPPGIYGLECQAERLRKKALYLPGSFDYDEIIRQWKTLEQAGGDVQNLDFHLTIDDKEVQRGHTADMLFRVDEIIAYVSRFMTLKIGDLLSTGTPVGVGPVSIGQHLQGYLGEEKVLDFNIR